MNEDHIKLTDRQIEDDHRHLEALLDRVDTTTRSWELAPLLEEMHKVLTVHFAHEEQERGALETAREAAPDQAELVSRLIEEHRAMLDNLESLVQEAHGAPETAPEDLLRKVGDVSHMMRRHEREERVLFQRVFKPGE